MLAPAVRLEPSPAAQTIPFPDRGPPLSRRPDPLAPLPAQPMTRHTFLRALCLFTVLLLLPHAGASAPANAKPLRDIVITEYGDADRRGAPAPAGAIARCRATTGNPRGHHPEQRRHGATGAD